MRTASARASERRIAQVSVERRVRGIDMKASPEESKAHKKVRVTVAEIFRERG
jgi:hypothetical protein